MRDATLCSLKTSNGGGIALTQHCGVNLRGNCHGEISAYELYEKRRREHGRALDDWLQAERELQDGLQFYRGVIHERKGSVGVHLQLLNSINE